MYYANSDRWCFVYLLIESIWSGPLIDSCFIFGDDKHVPRSTTRHNCIQVEELVSMHIRTYRVCHTRSIFIENQFLLCSQRADATSIITSGQYPVWDKLYEWIRFVKTVSDPFSLISVPNHITFERIYQFWRFYNNYMPYKDTNEYILYQTSLKGLAYVFIDFLGENSIFTVTHHDTIFQIFSLILCPLRLYDSTIQNCSANHPSQLSLARWHSTSAQKTIYCVIANWKFRYGTLVNSWYFRPCFFLGSIGRKYWVDPWNTLYTNDKNVNA